SNGKHVRSDRDCCRLTGYSSLIGLGRVADQTSPMRGLGANVAPRPEWPAGSQTHKSRRGLGESRSRGTLGDPGASLGQPCYYSRVTGELTALVGARVMGEHRHPALLEQFTVLEGA